MDAAGESGRSYLASPTAYYLLVPVVEAAPPQLEAAETAADAASWPAVAASAPASLVSVDAYIAADLQCRYRYPCRYYYPPGATGHY